MVLIQLNQPLASLESSSQPSKAWVVNVSAELTFLRELREISL